MKPRRALLIVAALAALGVGAAAPATEPAAASSPQACRFDGAPRVQRLDETSLRYCGRITGDGAAAFVKALRPADQVLYIASSGGELDAPLDLAEAVLKADLDVVVEGPCFSGCAAFVFVAGRRRWVSDAGLLGLHNTSSSAELLASRLLAPPPPGTPPGLRAAREWRLYQARGVALALLFEPQVRIGTVCVSDGGADPRNGEPVINLHSRMDLWVPSRRQWRDFGVWFTGTVPTREPQLRRRLAISAPEREYAAIRFAMGGKALKTPAEFSLYTLRLCPAS